MPSHAVHRWLDRLVLGKAYPEVHRLMDAPAFVIKGRRHRELFHDPVQLVLLFGDDPEKLASALLHVWLDEQVSKARDASRRKTKRRKRRRRRKT